MIKSHPLGAAKDPRCWPPPAGSAGGTASGPPASLARAWREPASGPPRPAHTHHRDGRMPSGQDSRAPQVEARAAGRGRGRRGPRSGQPTPCKQTRGRPARLRSAHRQTSTRQGREKNVQIIGLPSASHAGKEENSATRANVALGFRSTCRHRTPI